MDRKSAIDSADDDSVTAAPADPAALSARLPSLDGLRAVSIGLVLSYHAFFLHAEGRGVAWRLTHGLVGNGAFGVKAFFVVSGFLITTLLLREKGRTGRVDLPAFYARRAVRILPAFWAFVSTVALLSAAGVLAVPAADVWHALTFTWVYHAKAGGWHLGHTWSLGVEEQFYLLWPAVLAGCGVAGGRRAALTLLLATPLARLGLGLATPDGLYAVCRVVAVGRFDVLMCGCLAAMLFARGGVRAFLRSGRGAATTGGLFAAAWALAAARAAWTSVDRSAVTIVAGDVVEGVGLAAAVLYAVANPHGVVGRVMNWPPLAWVGTLSFSLYLWQQLFLPATATYAVQRWPVNLACALAAACVSFYGVERPAIRWHKRRLARRAAAVDASAAADSAAYAARADVVSAGRAVASRAAA